MYTEGTQQIIDILTSAVFFSLEMLIRLLCTLNNSYSQAPYDLQISPEEKYSPNYKLPGFYAPDIHIILAQVEL